jgi:hypothetical protein
LISAPPSMGPAPPSLGSSDNRKMLKAGAVRKAARDNGWDS